jgi:hypothetical protein
MPAQNPGACFGSTLIRGHLPPPPHDPEVSQRINRATKIVVSRTLDSPNQPGTTPPWPTIEARSDRTEGCSFWAVQC